MRKGISETISGTSPFNLKSLHRLQSLGYKFVQVKGLTIDRHYEYIEPHFLLLVPLMELPVNARDRDIYEPIDSEILLTWVSEVNVHTEILVANKRNTRQ